MNRTCDYFVHVHKPCRISGCGLYLSYHLLSNICDFLSCFCVYKYMCFYHPSLSVYSLPNLIQLTALDSMLEVDKVKPVHCVQTTIHTLNGPFCKCSAFHQQPSCAPSLQFLFDKFNGCAAVGHACTHGHVSCQEPDDSTLALLILQTASLAAQRQGVRGVT